MMRIYLNVVAAEDASHSNKDLYLGLAEMSIVFQTEKWLQCYKSSFVTFYRTNVAE